MTTSFSESENGRSHRLASPPVDSMEDGTDGKEHSSGRVGAAASAGADRSRRLRSERTDGTESTADASSGSTEEQPEKPRRRSFRLEEYAAQVLSGNILTRAEVRRQYPYIFFMAFLMLLYIANGYHIQKLHRRHDKLTAQIKELRSRSLTLSSIRMTATRQSEILKELQERGIPLHESLVPPQVIDK